MRIEIEHKSPNRAALVLRATMEANGGAWIANAVGAEGYVVARVGSLAGKRLSRSKAAGLCGPFTPADSQNTIDSALQAARAAYYAAYGPDWMSEEHPDDVFVPSHEAAYQAMQPDTLVSVDDLAKATGRSECSLKNAVWRLQKEGRIEMAVKAKGGHCPRRALYRMVA